MNNPVFKGLGGRPIVHGRTTKQSKEEKKRIRDLLKAMRESLKRDGPLSGFLKNDSDSTE